MAVTATIEAEILFQGAPDTGLRQPRHIGDVNGDGFGDYGAFHTNVFVGSVPPGFGPVGVIVEGGAAEGQGGRLFDFALPIPTSSLQQFAILPYGDLDGNGQDDYLIGPLDILFGSGIPFARVELLDGGPDAILPENVVEFEGPVIPAPPLIGSPGDVTGDGIPDVVFAFEAFKPGFGQGTTLAIAPGPASVPDAIRDRVLADVLVSRADGDSPDATPAALVPLGDVSGDGVADLGIVFRDNVLYVLFGGAHLAAPGELDLEALRAEGLATRINGDFRGGSDPWAPGDVPLAVTSAHIDGDDVLDLVIGQGFASFGDTGTFRASDGVMTVIPGGASLGGRIVSLALDIGSIPGERGLFTLDFVSGPTAPISGASELGRVLSSGDFDGDGRTDLAFLIGNGRIGVLTGGIAEEDILFDPLGNRGGRADLGGFGVDVTLIDMTSLGLGPDAFASEVFGSPSLSVTLDMGGDLDGDGADDLLIGLPSANFTDIAAAVPIPDGAVVVAYGGATGAPGGDPLVPIVNDTIVVNTLADIVDTDPTVTSLREAVGAANRAGRPITIELGAGTHEVEGFGGPGLSATGTMTIVGVGRSGDEATTIRGGSSLVENAVFSVQPSGSLSLRSLILTNDSTESVDEIRSTEGKKNSEEIRFHDGRGVTINEVSLFVDDVLFTELGSFSKVIQFNDVIERAVQKTYIQNARYELTNGGAIFNDGGVVEITDSTFSRNGAGNGGAIAQINTGQLLVEDTYFIENRSAFSMPLVYFGEGNIRKAGIGQNDVKFFNRMPVELDGGLTNRTDGSGSLIHNSGGVIELRGTITEAFSRDISVPRISTDTPVLGDFTLVEDEVAGRPELIFIRPEAAAGARIASFAAESEIAFESPVARAASAPEIAGPLLTLGEGALEIGEEGVRAFGAPTIEDGVITVVIAGLTVRFFGEGLTLDASAFDFDNALASLASLGGIVTEIVVEDVNGVEVLRLSGLELPAADIPATLATIGEGDFPNLLDLFGIAPAVLGGDGGDLVAGNGGDNLLIGGEGDDEYVFAGDFGADTVDETLTGGFDTLAFPDLAGPEALAVAVTEEAVILSVLGTENRVTVLRGAGGETGIEFVRFGFGESTAFADLIADAPPAPEAEDDTAEVSEDGPPVLIDALANDTGEGLTLLSVAAPARGEARIVDGLIEFDPSGAFEFLAAGETATETFAYIVSADALTAEGTISVTVLGADDRPPSLVLEAAPGQRLLEGGGGDDVLSALLGARGLQMFGGAGADVFRFALENGARDTVYLRDFTPGEDRVDLGGVAFADLTIRATARDLRVTLPGEGDTLVFDGLAELSADDFIDRLLA